MLAHDLGLALASFRRNPLMATLASLVLAVGMAAALVTITIYHIRSGHPIGWKDDRLFAVTLDNRPDDPEITRNARHPEYPPFQLTYRDAQALYRSGLPERSLMMFKARQAVAPRGANARPFQASVRVTTADFFGMFDVPFVYGAPWYEGDWVV